MYVNWFSTLNNKVENLMKHTENAKNNVNL